MMNQNLLADECPEFSCVLCRRDIIESNHFLEVRIDFRAICQVKYKETFDKNGYLVKYGLPMIR